MTDMPPYLTAKDEDNKNSGQTDSDCADTDDWDLPHCFDKPRHLEPIKGAERVEHTWRVKEKYKTHCVALVLCLNVGVDPPDVVKTQPCARLECWIDPQSLSPSKALESIGHALQAQYERWQPRARYKQSLDPTSDEVKKLCCSLRRNAKDERVLFHYNGHGVPRPTAQGEIWVFNRAYTQYIPLSMYDLQTWMGAPSLYVYDCSSAGVIIDNFKQFAEQHERDYEMAAAAGTLEGAAGGGGGGGAVSFRNCIQLAACGAGQTLPQHPELPADLFTACLTTPVKMAMKWFVLRHRATHRATPPDLIDLIDKIPGQVTDRRTMLGELNWIFTAITDTIAWSSLPPDLFQQLFRADLLTASLCRNFLLADRIMRSYNCTPVSQPALPSLSSHALWLAWEHTLELALAQLPALLSPRPPHYQHSPFFRDQLTAFEIWLDLGKWCGGGSRRGPEQLPMVLQVLLSTLHRLRALQILCRFLALGSWAARAVLHVGIFPYMLKLLQASAPDLRPAMVYIWAKILAVDPSCQVDLVNAKGHKYFLSVLQDPTVDSTHRTLAAFVLAHLMESGAGQEAALQGGALAVLLELLTDAHAPLRQWAAIALGRAWRRYDAARWAGVRDLAHEKLCVLLDHPEPEVRAAAAFALGTFISAGGGGGAGGGSDHAAALQQQVGLQLARQAPRDASPLVRAEILNALQWLVLIFEQHFIAVYFQDRLRRSDKATRRGAAGVDCGQDALEPAAPPPPRAAPPLPALPAIGFGSVYTAVWSAVCELAREPHPQVSGMARDVIEHVTRAVDSALPLPLPLPPQPASLPPSPNTRGEPVALHAHSTHTLPGGRRGRSSGGAGGEPGGGGGGGESWRSPVVSTEFVEWCTARVARPAEQHQPDVESRQHHERVWRRQRDARLRHEAKGLSGARPARLETQSFHSRCPLPPAAVLFHPYDQHIAVASKDNFGIWDWGTAAKLCVGTWRRGWGRISALEWVEAGGAGLVAAAGAGGVLALYRPGGDQPALRAVWRALPATPPQDYRPPPAQPLYSLAQLVSEQWGAGEQRTGSPSRSGRGGVGGAAGVGGAGEAGGYRGPPPGTLVRWSDARRTLALGGPASVLRLWDADSERLAADVPTQTAAAVTALWRAPDQLLAGFADGAVRRWDERDPAAPACLTHAHTAPVLAAALRTDIHTLVTACADGYVRLHDTRRLGGAGGEVCGTQAPGPLAAVDVHPLCSLIACGSVNQCISIYDLKGAALNTIRHHEGFMGARIGPVSCLAFHPLKCALGVGSKDATVSVYCGEARR